MLSALTDLAAYNASLSLAGVQSRLENSIQHLASGRRINSAGDDAAGLAISKRMRVQLGAIDVQTRSLNDMVSLTQVADSALSHLGDNLQRIRDLAVQAGDDTLSSEDRQALQLEASQLFDASLQIQTSTQFNGRALLDGTFRASVPDSNGTPSLSFNITPLFQPSAATVSTQLVQMGQAAVTATPVRALNNGDLVIDGTSIGATSAGGQAGQNADSAWALANAINLPGSASFSAQANATTASGTTVVLANNGNVHAGDIVINGVPVQAGFVVSAINGIAAQTGVSVLSSFTAALGGGSQQLSLTLQASDGRDIDVSGAVNIGVANHTVGSVTITGAQTAQSSANLVISGAHPDAAGLSAGTIPAGAVGSPVSELVSTSNGYDLALDFSTSANAATTLNNVDQKIDQLATMRTTFGSVQSVLASEGSNLASSRLAISASLSRIEDVDYANEVTQLARNKILENSGVAVSAQANAESSRLLRRLLTGAMA